MEATASPRAFQDMEPRVVTPFASLSTDRENDPAEHSLTRESLFLLNLDHEKLDHHQQLQQQRADSNFTTTPELTSSSSSSLASFEEGSKAQKEAERIYNNSNSSVATIVQRLASSSSTLDLDEHKDLTPHLQLSSIQHIKDGSTTSLSSLNSDNNDTGSVTTDTTAGPRRLKSSLKLNRLQRSRSLPHAKTVRFSSDLTDVKTFNEFAKPSSISLENSPEQSSTEFESDDDDDDEPKAYFDLKTLSISNSTSSEEESEEDCVSYKSNLRQSSWKLQGTNYDFYNLKGRPQVVKLTSLCVLGSKLVGSVDVRNMSFEKYVEVKFTTDGWNSIYLITAGYSRSVDSTTDQFTFALDLNTSIMMNSKKMLRKNSSHPISVELCVKYISNGTDVFYDNNAGANYRLELISTMKQKRAGHSKKSSKQVRSPSYIDDNFAGAKITSPAKITTTGRYFSDDTDYFHGSSNKLKLAMTEPSHSLKSCSDSSSHEQLLSASVPLSQLGTSNSQREDSYSDFLQKYCFFKPDQHAVDCYR